jgi:hypothetical protein
VSEFESRAILDLLYAHLTKPEHIVRHRWRTGDVALWGNRSTAPYANRDSAPSDESCTGSRCAATYPGARTRSGDGEVAMAVPLSVLDLAPLVSGSDITDALRRSIDRPPDRTVHGGAVRACSTRSAPAGSTSGWAGPGSGAGSAAGRRCRNSRRRRGRGANTPWTAC